MFSREGVENVADELQKEEREEREGENRWKDGGSAESEMRNPARRREGDNKETQVFMTCALWFFFFLCF